jgi:hypothetical protein
MRERSKTLLVSTIALSGGFLVPLSIGIWASRPPACAGEIRFEPIERPGRIIFRNASHRIIPWGELRIAPEELARHLPS